MNSKKHLLKTLGPKSAKFVSDLKEAGKSVSTLDEAQAFLEKNPQDASQFIRDLIHRHIVFRLTRGIYLLLETTKESAQLSNWPIIAKALATANDYYISHYAAMRLHGMTTHALTNIQITLPKRCRSKIIQRIKYDFIYIKPQNIWGVEQMWVSKHDKICVSDLERTILDCLNRTDLCGGLVEVFSGIWILSTKINWTKMIDYSDHYPNKAAVKRLGYMAEVLDQNPEVLKKLHKIIADRHDYVLLDPSEEKSGQYYKKWRLQLNIKNLKEYIIR